MFKKAFIITGVFFAVVLIVLSILGAKERTGYLEVLNTIENEFTQSSWTDTNAGWVNGVHKTEKAVLFSTDVRTKTILEMAKYLSSGDKTLEIDKVVDWGGVYLKNAEDLKDFEYPNKIYALDEDKKVLNDINIYQVRIRYYSKIFRNSDIYGVYAKTDKLINDNILSIKFDEAGSPFGYIVSSTKLGADDKIDNVAYTLRVKGNIYLALLYVLIVVFLLGIKTIYTIIFSKKFMIVFGFFAIVLISLNILGAIKRVGYIEIKSSGVIEENIYNARLRYYTKIFRNSDIYGVKTIDIADTLSIIEHIERQEKGSPFITVFTKGNIVEDFRVENVEYTLYVKNNIYFYVSALMFIILLFLFAGKLIMNFVVELPKLILKSVNKKQVIIISIFILFLTVPHILFKIVYNKLNHTNTENRALAKRPEIVVPKDILEFSKNYEGYFNDYFPFRNQFKRLNAVIDYTVFNRFPLNLKKSFTLIGKNGWLFAIDKNLLDLMTGELFSEKELHQIHYRFSNIKEKYDGYDIELVLLFAPYKENIYHEYLPNYIKASRYRKVDQVVEYFKTNSDIKVISPKEELITLKPYYQTHYKLDGHWNVLGGFVGAQQLYEVLGNERLYLSNMTIEHENVFTSGRSRIVSGFDLIWFAALPYHFYNDMDYYITSTNEFKKNNQSIMIIGDSYIWEMKSFFDLQFKDTSYIINSDNINTNNYKPDYLVLEMVDRNFWKLDNYFTNLLLTDEITNTFPNIFTDDPNKN